MFIGANDDNDICLDIPSVSGRHAVLTRTASGYAIADLNSTNGTYINGTRIHKAAVNLQYGQELRLGVAVLRAE
jgi:pSer/pThr/pTyr-binding forkhead associated (FHA) protein